MAATDLRCGEVLYKITYKVVSVYEVEKNGKSVKL